MQHHINLNHVKNRWNMVEGEDSIKENQRKQWIGNRNKPFLKDKLPVDPFWNPKKKNRRNNQEQESHLHHMDRE